MTQFIIYYHIIEPKNYIKDIKTYKSHTISFKWYEYISRKKIVKRFFETLQENYPVMYKDIDSIHLIF